MASKKLSTSSIIPEASEKVFIKLLVYSPAGHGKTHLIGTAASDERFWPMLLVDFESGVASIRSRIRTIRIEDLGKVEPVLGKIDRVQAKTWQDFQTIHDFLVDNPGIYKAVGIDSLSEMNYLNMATILDTERATDPKHDPDIAEQRDYLRSATQMRTFIRAYRDLDMHVIFACLAQEAQDARTKKYQMRPSLTGKLAGEIPGIVETVGYLAIVEDEEAGEEYRYMFTTPTERFMAKDRSEGGLLSPGIKNPSLPMILDLLEGKILLDELE